MKKGKFVTLPTKDLKCDVYYEDKEGHTFIAEASTPESAKGLAKALNSLKNEEVQSLLTTPQKESRS